MSLESISKFTYQELIKIAVLSSRTIRKKIEEQVRKK